MAQQRNAEPIGKWVSQLSSQEVEEQAFAACELGRLSCGSDCKVHLVVSTGAIPPLISLLSSPHALVQEHAVGTLGTIATYPSSRAAIPAAVVAPAVFRLLLKDSLEVQRNAADALAHLAYECSDNKAAVIAAGAILPLDLLCGSSCNVVQLFAARALCNVAAGNRQFESLIATRALPTLVRQLMPGNRVDTSSHDYFTKFANFRQQHEVSEHSNSRTEDYVQSAVQHSALGILLEVLLDDSFSSRTCISMLRAAGAPESAVALLQDGDRFVKDVAAELFCCMMCMDSRVANIVAPVSAIPIFIPLLQSSHQALATAAACALAPLLINGSNSEAFAAAGGLDVLAALLHEPTMQKLATDLLVEITVGDSSIPWMVPDSVQSAATGILPSMVQLLHSKEERVMTTTAMIIARLTHCNSKNQTAVAAAGTIPLLVQLLRSKVTRVQGAAVVLLEALVLEHSSNKAALTHAGGIPAVLHTVCSSDLALRGQAALLLNTVTYKCSSAHSAAVAAGAIHRLLPLLNLSHAKSRTFVAAALGRLATNLDLVGGLASLTLQESSTCSVSPPSASRKAAAAAVSVLVSALWSKDSILQITAGTSLFFMLKQSRKVVSEMFLAAGGTGAISYMEGSYNPDARVLAKDLLKNLERART